ncbi:MAG: NAD(P)-dependent oxidoreductase, partial [Solirubrobacterales bacterium]
AAASDIVGLCVSTDDDVLDLAKAGLLAGLGAGGVLVNHGTGTPATAVELNRLCQEVGASALDAPVSGGRRGAEAKTLTTLVGGPPETAKRCEPVFRTFSEHVVYLGGPGKGQTAKLFNNALLILNQASIAEVIGLSERFDVEPMAMVEVLRLGSGSSRALHHINTIMRPDTVEHLSMLLDLDLDIFQAALRDQQVAAGDLIARGRAGIAGLPDLIERLNR